MTGSLMQFLPKMLDRAYLRVWWWVEGRALARIEKRWPVEYRDWKRDDSRPRSDLLTDAYQHLSWERRGRCRLLGGR